jgi:Zn-finger nucleic acid-binding protein
MKCPNCNETLLIAERHRVEIDYCPSCRGVWLDRGELDKLLDQVNERTGGNRPEYASSDSRFESSHEHSAYQQKHPRKKKSFFSEMFDFD